MSHALQVFIQQYRPKIESSLFDHLPLSRQQCTRRFNEAIQYAIFPGGKRWRPVLTLLGGMVVGVAPHKLFAAACAIEYLHTSSMIIDDLPAMDDADLRRGKPSLHRAYDESTAMLASLALLNHSYQLLATTCQQTGHPETAGQLIMNAAQWIGAEGMIGGQVIDLELRGDTTSYDKLDSRNLKTTALMSLMMTTGAIASKSGESEITTLSKFGEALGTAYQIYDDLLDELGETKLMGKNPRQDLRHGCPSFVSEYGVCRSQKMAAEILEEGIDLLRRQFGNCTEVSILVEAVQLIITSSNLPLHSNQYEKLATH